MYVTRILLMSLWVLPATLKAGAQKEEQVDTARIPAGRRAQQEAYLKGEYPFPAKPRSQWEIGVKGGQMLVIGDVAGRWGGLSGGVHVRKAFGYLFSVRLDYVQGVAKGMSSGPAENYAKNTAWNGYSAPRRTASGAIVSSSGATGYEPVFYNYRADIKDLSLQAVLSLNNVRFHREKSRFNYYFLVGGGLMVYNTKVNAHNSSGGRYDFTTIPGMGASTSEQRLKALKNKMDKSYETPAEQDGKWSKALGGNLRQSVTAGGGIAFRISRGLNLFVEDRVTMINDDLLDGQRWQEHSWGDAALTGGWDLTNMVSVGLNIAIGSHKKNSEPLWWQNPLQAPYEQMRQAKGKKDKNSNEFKDTDGDGVPDQFDLEATTPKGCAVDVRGVILDTDGDGVPDCRDKELITPTICQPVDKDGVGRCPATTPGEGGEGKMGTSAGTGNLPQQCSILQHLTGISFGKQLSRLDERSRKQLAVVARKLKDSPECYVKVTGYCSSSKVARQLSWERVNAVIGYLVEKEGISRERLVFEYGKEGGDCQSVNFMPLAQGDGGIDPPPPLPGRTGVKR